VLGGKQPLTGIRVAQPRHCAGFSLSADQVLEIPDFDARVEKERAKMAARKVEIAQGHGGARENAGRKAKEMKELVESVEAAQAHGGKSRDKLSHEKDNRKRKSQFAPERIIARLKRDAQTDPNAQALLDTLSAGDISARRVVGFHNCEQIPESHLRPLAPLTDDKPANQADPLPVGHPAGRWRFTTPSPKGAV